MISTRTLERDIYAALETLGVSKTKLAGVFLWNFPDSPIAGWLGVAVHRHRKEGYHTIDPNVGVHYAELEKLWYELTDVKPPKAPVATVYTNIGYLSPMNRFLGYRLDFDQDPEDLVARVVSDISTYGVPWMGRLLDRSALARAIAETNPPDHAAFVLPLLFLLEGRPEKALDVLAKYKASRQRVSKFTERYRLFEDRFRVLVMNRLRERA